MIHEILSEHLFLLCTNDEFNFADSWSRRSRGGGHLLRVPQYCLLRHQLPRHRHPRGLHQALLPCPWAQSKWCRFWLEAQAEHHYNPVFLAVSVSYLIHSTALGPWHLLFASTGLSDLVSSITVQPFHFFRNSETLKEQLFKHCDHGSFVLSISTSVCQLFFF